MAKRKDVGPWNVSGMPKNVSGGPVKALKLNVQERGLEGPERVWIPLREYGGPVKVIEGLGRVSLGQERGLNDQGKGLDNPVQ